MLWLRRLNREMKKVVWTAAAACLALFFAVQAFYGDRGIISLRQLNAEVATAQELLQEVSSVRQKLQHRVDLLSSGSLDLDMLDERARVMLNVARPDEVLILTETRATAAPHSH